MLGNAAFVGFIPVRNLDSARDFYCGLLGLRAVEQTQIALVVDAGGTPLRLTEVADLRPQPFTIAGWRVGDISSTVTSLIEADVPISRFDGIAQDEQGVWTAPSGDRIAWFADPDGNVLSVTAAPG